jgi:hypothetical protein
MTLALKVSEKRKAVGTRWHDHCKEGKDETVITKILKKIKS